MCKIKTEIKIKAPSIAVWRTLTNFKAYPEWNPFIIRIDQIDDKNLHVEMMSGKSKMTFKPVIVLMKPHEELRWIGKMGGVSWLFKGEHYFILEEKNKETHFIHGEIFSGLLAVLLWPFIKKDIHRNFTKMNQALKERVEG